METDRYDGPSIRLRVDHCSLPVGDIEEGIRFYTDVVGLERIERPDFGFPGAWFRAGTTPVHLTTGGTLRGAGARLRPNEGHVAFCVDEGLDTLLDRIRDAGASRSSNWRTRPAAERQLFTLDPWGNMLEFCRYTPAPPGDGSLTLRIAVSGGSIGGVTAALWLRDAGHEVDVFERSPGRLEGRGAGIVLHEATLRFLVERCGAPVESVSEGARALEYLGPAGDVVFAEPTDLRFTSWNTLHRRLLRELDEDRFHLGQPVVGFHEVPGGVGGRCTGA